MKRPASELRCNETGKSRRQRVPDGEKTGCRGPRLNDKETSFSCSEDRHVGRGCNLHMGAMWHLLLPLGRSGSYLLF